MDLFDFLGRQLGIAWWFVGNVTPYVWRAIRDLLSILYHDLIALIQIEWEKSKVVSDCWTAEAVRTEPKLSRYDHIIWWIIRIAGIVTLITAWIVLSYITVWIVGVIF